MFLENKVIYILSPEPFGGNLLSKHHYAIELARRNHVYLICYKKNMQEKFLLREVRPGIQEICFRNSFRFIYHLPSFICRQWFAYEIKNIIRSIGEPPDVVISFFPYFFWWLKDFGARVCLFGLYDYIPHIPRRAYEILAQCSDILFSVSQPIADYYHIRNVKLINHAVPAHFFTDPPEMPASPKEFYRIGYLGNVGSSLLDLTLIEELVNKFSSHHFYFIGPVGSSNISAGNEENAGKLRQYANVFLIPEKSGEELKRCMREIDVWICPYHNRDLLRTSNSLKIIFYLATGRPVVSSRIAYYDAYPSSIVMQASTHDEFICFLQEVLEHYSHWMSNDLVMKRINIAKESTYEKNVERINAWIEEFLYAGSR